MRDPRERAKAVFVAIALSQEKGVYRNLTNANKAFWKSHVYFMRDHGTELTGWKITHLPLGPGAERYPDLLAELQDAGVIRLVPTNRSGYPGSDIQIIDKDKAQAIVQAAFDADALESIRRGAEEFSKVSAKDASDRSHIESVAWRSTINGDAIPTYLDLVAEDESAVKSAQERIKLDEEEWRKRVGRE